MKKYLSRRKKKTILTALALGLCLLTPWHRAEAVTSYTTPNGLFRLDYYSAGEKVTGKWYDEIMLVGGGQNNHSKGGEKRPILGKLRNQQLSLLNLFSNRFA